MRLNQKPMTKIGHFAKEGALGLWVAESCADILLALNRCAEAFSPQMNAKLFGGRRVYIWLSLITLYGIFFVLFTRPLLFSSIYVSWFFNPHVGYANNVRQQV